MWTQSYHLLPFTFDNFNEEEIIVNLVGDFLIVPKSTVYNLVNRIQIEDELFFDLLGNNFI